MSQFQEALMAKKQLTDQQIRAAERLKEAFMGRKHVHGYTHEKASLELGWTTSAITQYLNGYMALNMDALVKICSLIQANAVEIYPELFEGVDLGAISDPDGLIEGFHRADANTQEAIKVLLKMNR